MRFSLSKGRNVSYEPIRVQPLLKKEFGTK